MAAALFKGDFLASCAVLTRARASRHHAGNGDKALTSRFPRY
jgi:hypothetical protein